MVRITFMSRRLLGGSAVLALLLVVVFAASGGLVWLARVPARLVCVCDPPDGSYDAIILMMGDSRARRVAAAVDYFKAGVAPRIQIVQPEPHPYEQYGLAPSEATLARSLAAKLGVPDERITVINSTSGPRATSSFEEAQIHLDYMKGEYGVGESSPRRVLLVTDWFHTSRARWIFRKVFADAGIVVDAAPAAAEQMETWWTDEGAFIGLFNEYLKWTYYLLKYS